MIVSRRISQAIAISALALFSGAWVHAAPDYTSASFAADQWQSPYPYLWVKCTSDMPTVFPNGTTEYAGAFGGVNDLTGQRYDIICNELNHDINIGTRYTADFYNDYVNMPIQDGRGGTDNGAPLTLRQKQILDGMFVNLGVAQQVVGISVHGGQDLGGVTRGNLTDPTLLMSLSNEDAAAYQLFAWELIHEKFNAADPLANVNLTSGDLIWTNPDGTPLPDSLVQRFNEIAAESLGNAVPEPFVLGAPAIAIAVVALRRRGRARA